MTFSIIRPTDDETTSATPMELVVENCAVIITALMTEATLLEEEKFDGEHEMFRTVACSLYIPAEA
jgi:hypothetical protein